MRAEQRSILRYLRMKTVLVVNLLLVALVAWGFMGEYYRTRELKKEIAVIDARAEELRKGNLELGELREKFSGAGELEREARVKLNLQKPGELVVVIQGDPTAFAARSAETSQDGMEQPRTGDGGALDNVRRWWEFFFKQS
jgi:cell division protein FtsB